MECDRRTLGSAPPSFFHHLKTREIHGVPVRKRPNIGDLESESGGFGAGVIAIEHDGVITPPLSVSFSKTRGSCHLLAVSDEDGYLGIYDTRLRLPSLASCRENAGKARICEWVAHHNAIFDICWIKDDTQILTASGDQSIKIWDTEKRKCLGALVGHTGSVKSLSSHPSNPGLIVSGSRDGSFALWDMRCKPCMKNKNEEVCLTSTAVVKAAHVVIPGRKGRRGKVMQAANKSVTSVLYLKDEICVASAGAADSIVKFWDTRNLKFPCTQSLAQAKPSTVKEKGQHGISSLSQDSNGVFIAASCMDNRVYLHDVLRLDKGPVHAFPGSRIESFYVKATISPDASYVLGGSSDGNAYLWKVQRPQESPVILKGHEGEVTAVSWCPSEMGKIASASDDFTMRIWNVRRSSSFISARSPSPTRERVSAVPSEGQKQMMNEQQSHHDEKPQVDTKERSSLYQSEVEVRTPQSAKKKIHLSPFFMVEDLQLEKTPDSAFESPSSVLNLPSSLKRKTIRDYFVAKP